MRIIAGSAGSLSLEVPPDLTRPTTDRVREAVFSSLGDRVVGADVLDLFAGSGSLGIEALSRGAASAAFVDDAPDAGRAIEQNLRRSGLAGGVVHRADALGFLRRRRHAGYEVIFADPPYARDEAGRELLRSLLDSEPLAAALRPGGILVLETSRRTALPETGRWTLAKEKIYGKTRVSYLAPAEPAA